MKIKWFRASSHVIGLLQQKRKSTAALVLHPILKKLRHLYSTPLSRKMAGLPTPFKFDGIYLQSFLNTQSKLSTEQVNSPSVRFFNPFLLSYCQLAFESKLLVLNIIIKAKPFPTVLGIVSFGG